MRKNSGKWSVVASAHSTSLEKQHHLQGPIDDAFMARFIFVTPTGSAANSATSARIQEEMQHAIKEWRRQFRGEPLVKKDSEINDADIASANLVLWGDPGSNAFLAKIADKLPLKWTTDSVKLGTKSFPADKNYPAMIYPNPLNAHHYVVLNSGFTFREFDYLNNARQISKLPDWAMIDISTPADGRWPGKITDAGFFGEKWELK